MNTSRTSHRLTRTAGAALAAVGLLGAFAPVASAAPQAIPNGSACPNVKVMFARGTNEPAGVGRVGQAFADALQAKIGGRSMDVYGIQYPATLDFPRAADGVNDAVTQIEATAAQCPNTKIVLGGFSQGAAVAGFTTANVVPPGVDTTDLTNPMPASMAKHVSAVVLFGKPGQRFMNLVGQPQVVVGPAYTGKTLDSCAEDDPVCSNGFDIAQHNAYIDDGMVDQAATFAANRIAGARG